MTCLALITAACDDPAPPPIEPDGGTAATLEVLDPPGESVGLAFGASGLLRVRYLRRGEPARGVQVDFALVADAARQEDAGGSSLDVAKAITDDDGIARVTLVAGAARVNFRVEASAPEAGVATFYVTVANEGFADLEVTPRHAGAAVVDVVEVRLYGTAQSCAALDPRDPPPSPYPPRSMESFDAPARFGALGAGESYSVLVWGRTADGRVVAAGCVDLDPASVRPASTLRLDVIVNDLPVAAAPRYEVTSGFVLGGDLLGGSDVWSTALACPFGVAQLVLDAALLTADDMTAAALDARRGVLDAATGCRGELDPSGGASLESLAPVAWPAAIQDKLGYFTLVSTLELAPGVATHTLQQLALGTAEPVIVELHQTARPTLTATATWAAFVLGEHGFTLRLDEALGDTGALVSTSVDCTPFCLEAGLAADCLADPCGDATPGLDAAFAAPIARLDASGIDFTLASTMLPLDADADLVAEGLSGAWQATILIDGAPAPLGGGLSASALD